MSMNKRDWQSEYEERRDRQREYEGDVVYEVWRRGGNPDAIDFERYADEVYYQEPEPDALAAREVRRQDEPRRRAMEEDEQCIEYGCQAYEQEMTQEEE